MRVLESTSTREHVKPQAFPYGPVLTVALGHFVHDTFSAFLAPLLPLLIPRLGLTLAAAGSLSSFLQWPSVLNPLIGVAADRFRARWLMAFAPAITATLMTLLGWPRDYASLALLLFGVGLSVAVFHATAPALVAQLAPRQTGRGMSLFMAAGELGRTTGPLLAVAAVGWWGVNGLPRLALVGWLTTGVLVWRLRMAEPPANLSPRWRAAWRRMWPVFRALVVLVIGRAALVGMLGWFLPVYLVGSGWTRAQAGWWFALYEAAGVMGALLLGPRSDRIGRRRALLGAQGAGVALVLLWQGALHGQGSLWLLPVGFTLLAAQPITLALVQDYFPDLRATANGVYLTLSFLIRPLLVTGLGALADRWGLQTAFVLAALLAGGSLLALVALPTPPSQEAA